ncbi:MAG TPA: 4-hydroxy-tetrahydrodipicolinate synthase [Phnomibacter sp.]|nr:4-hydroxy-tetrahydrodipicolinate synthase [Phnomibacter sp.]
MNQLVGVGTALVTPFNAQGHIDFNALQRLIEYNLTGKVNYLVTLGTTGEAATLSEEEKLEVLQFTLQCVAGRVPVVVGIGGNNTKGVIRQMQQWPLDKVTAILSVSPYYNKPSQEGIYQHYAALAQNSPLPIILYNVPGRTSSNLTADTTLRLANDFENIVAMKEASGNMVQCMHLAAKKPNHFVLLSGDDHIALPLIACGYQGVISVISNCYPAVFSQLIRCALAGNFEDARPLQAQLLDKMDLLFAENNPAGVKAFLAEMGIIENHLRLPLVPLSSHWLQKVKAAV